MTEFRETTRPEASACAAQPAPSFPYIELRRTFPSNLDIISPLVAELTRFISRFRAGDNFEIELALSEALANAILHGNQEDPHKHVYVSCRCSTNGEVSITVQDEGKGFEINAVPDPTTPNNRLGRSGRGIYLIKALMDDVCFEQRGTIVHMRKAIAVRNRMSQRATLQRQLSR